MLQNLLKDENHPPLQITNHLRDKDKVQGMTTNINWDQGTEPVVSMNSQALLESVPREGKLKSLATTKYSCWCSDK